MLRYEITDQQWKRVAHLLPSKVGDVGRSAADNRLYYGKPVVEHPGETYPDDLAPHRRSGWNSVYQRFRRWAKAHTWKAVFEELQEPDLDWLMIGSTQATESGLSFH